jgi:hypothetical protein
MMKSFTFAAILLLCACFAAAQTPGTTQSATGQPQVTRPVLEFANATQAKIAWTSKQGQDLVVQYSTDPNNFNQAVDAIEQSGGDNHRGTMTNLQPNTTYYVRMTDKNGQPVGSVYSFKTPAQGAAPIHQQPLSPK